MIQKREHDMSPPAPKNKNLGAAVLVLPSPFDYRRTAVGLGIVLGMYGLAKLFLRHADFVLPLAGSLVVP
jgi:hypothetical protein